MFFLLDWLIEIDLTAIIYTDLGSAAAPGFSLCEWQANLPRTEKTFVVGLCSRMNFTFHDRFPFWCFLSLTGGHKKSPPTSLRTAFARYGTYRQSWCPTRSFKTLQTPHTEGQGLCYRRLNKYERYSTIDPEGSARNSCNSWSLDARWADQRAYFG